MSNTGASGSSSSHLPVNSDALGALLASATAKSPQYLHHDIVPPSPPDHSASWQDPHSPVTGINWNLLGATENTLLENSPLQEYIQSVSQASLDFINNDLSDDELLERISIGSDSSHAPEGVYLFFSHLAIVQLINFNQFKIFPKSKMSLLQQNVHATMQQIPKLPGSGFHGPTGL